MEFEEQEDEMNLHEEEEEEEEEDDAVYDSPPPPHPPRVLKATTESPDTTGTTSTGAGAGTGGFMVVHGGSGSSGGSRFRFRECLKNQAVNIGGHAVDGCGEFMPAGIEGTIDALKCAACGCHRNFHRKELPYFHHAPPQPPQGFYRLPAPVSYRPPPPPQQQPPAQAPPLQLALPPPPPHHHHHQEDDYNNRMETSSAEGVGGGGGTMRKRFRTKFTAEQKERMLGLAERIGWRIQRQDDEVINRFCSETGVSRQVLKVWLHNNKHTLGKSSSPLHHQNPTHPHPHPHPQSSSSYHHEPQHQEHQP